MKKTVSITLAVIVLLGGLFFMGQKLFAVYPPGFEECANACFDEGEKTGFPVDQCILEKCWEYMN